MKGEIQIVSLGYKGWNWDLAAKAKKFYILCQHKKEVFVMEVDRDDTDCPFHLHSSACSISGRHKEAREAKMRGWNADTLKSLPTRGLISNVPMRVVTSSRKQPKPQPSGRTLGPLIHNLRKHPPLWSEWITFKQNDMSVSCPIRAGREPSDQMTNPQGYRAHTHGPNLPWLRVIHTTPLGIKR